MSLIYASDFQYAFNIKHYNLDYITKVENQLLQHNYFIAQHVQTLMNVYWGGVFGRTELAWKLIVIIFGLWPYSAKIYHHICMSKVIVMVLGWAIYIRIENCSSGQNMVWPKYFKLILNDRIHLWPLPWVTWYDQLTAHAEELFNCALMKGYCIFS